MKSDILKFSEKITEGLDKPTTKFVSEMIYGIERSNSILFSEIARALKERIKLKNTIERLCNNCNEDSDVNKEYSNNHLMKNLILLKKTILILL